MQSTFLPRKIRLLHFKEFLSVKLFACRRVLSLVLRRLFVNDWINHGYCFGNFHKIAVTSGVTWRDIEILRFSLDCTAFAIVESNQIGYWEKIQIEDDVEAYHRAHKLTSLLRASNSDIHIILKLLEHKNLDANVNEYTLDVGVLFIKLI